MGRQKWSGVKLTKREEEELRRTERAELIAEIIGFFFILGVMFLIVILMTIFLGGGQ